MIPKPLRLYAYHARSFWNWRASQLSRFVEPSAYFLFLIVGLRSSLSGFAPDYELFALSGMACFLAFRVGASTLVDVANDRKWGVFALYVLQGGGAFGYLVSIISFSVTVFIAQFTLICVVASVVFGVSPVAEAVVVIIVPAIFICAGWVAVGAAVGARVQSYARRDMLVILTSLPFVLSAPLFYPLDEAPLYLRLISQVNPLTYQVGWLRDGALGSYLAAVVWAAATAVLALVLLRASDKVSRER